MSTKRILSLVLALVMVLGTFGSLVFADEATNNEKVNALIEDGLVQGYEDGTYGLDKPITRAEVATMIVRALGAETEANGMLGIPSRFSDMGEALWANGNVNYAVGKAIVNGYPDGTFKPKANVTYNEVAKMLVMAFELVKVEDVNKVDWPLGWLTKAAENGILEGVTGVNFNDAAVRENVFEMIYNAYYNMEVGYNTVVKAIVLENNRVERIGANEVVVEVIKLLQRANYVDESRASEQGDQERYVIDAKVGDVEDLLGKVVDLTINREGKVVRAKVDDTYKYLQGPVTATKNKLSLGATGYTVELGEKYRGTDERVFRTYLNDEAHQYEDFYQDPATVRERVRPASFNADYARFTVKNGKVLFIDAFVFDDIAPVKDVRRDGLDVYVYNDFRDAREEKFEPRALVVGFNDGVFSRIDREDIKTNDVVHVYNKNRLIVRQDALETGVYSKVERDRWGDYYAHVGEDAYFINDVDYFRPVYAHDSKTYTTLYTRNAQGDLANFYKEEVVVLIDINDDLQLFGADVEYNEGMAIVEQILARGQGKFLQRDDERVILDETFDSIISHVNLDAKNTTTNQKLYNFDKNDLVFLLGDGDNIERLVRIEKVADMKAKAEEMTTVKAVDMNNNFIRVKRGAGDYRYQVLDRTNVFVIDAKGNASATTVAKLQARLDLTSEKALEVYVLNDKTVSGLIDDKVIVDRNRITREENVAHTLVFFAPDYAFVADGETVLVTNIYTARTPHYLEGQRPDNEGKTMVERTAERGVVFNNVNVKDIVSLKLTKNDDKLVQRVDVLIGANDYKTNSYKVVGGDLGREYSRYEYRRLILEDANRERTTYWLVRNAEEFGTITVDSVVTFHTERNGDIDVIQVHPRGTAVTANRGPVVERPEGSEVFNGIFELDGNNWVKLGSKDPVPYIGGNVNLVNGDFVYVTYETIRGETVVTKLVKAETEVTPPGPGEEDEVKVTAKYQLVFGMLHSVEIYVENADLEDITEVKIDGTVISTDDYQVHESGEYVGVSVTNSNVSELKVTINGESYTVNIQK